MRLCQSQQPFEDVQVSTSSFLYLLPVSRADEKYLPEGAHWSNFWAPRHRSEAPAGKHV
jgi:hypothetical protein